MTKHILCVIGQLGNGGSEKQLYLFLKHLDKTRYSASVFVAGRKEGIWSERLKNDLKVKIIASERDTAISKIALYRKLLKTEKPDIVFSWSFFTNVFAWCSPRLKFIGSLRTQYAWELRGTGAFRCRLAFKANPLIVNSNAIKNELENSGVNSEKIRVIFNIFGIPQKHHDDLEDVAIQKFNSGDDFRKHYSIPTDSIIVIGVGRDTPEKNFPFFIDVVAKAAMTNPKVHGVIAGGGGPPLEEEIDERELGDKITILGEVPFAVDYMRFADIFFLSSITEGMPNVLLEALSVGCAPLATDVGGVRDVFSQVPDEILGKILLEDYDVDTAAGKLIELAESPDLRETAARAASAFLNQLEPAKVMRQYYEIFEKL